MPSAELRGVTLDCDDPQSLARFYQELTGMTVGFSSDGYVALTGGPGPALGFQRVDHYRAPHWPDQQIPQQLHLDFAVEDLDAAIDLSWPWARLDLSINRAGTATASFSTLQVTRFACSRRSRSNWLVSQHANQRLSAVGMGSVRCRRRA